MSLNIIIIIFNFESFVTANKFNETENTNYFFYGGTVSAITFDRMLESL